MRHDATSTTLRIPHPAFIKFCPKCEPRRIMALQAIRPASFPGSDVITFKCGKCGTERAEIMT
jgi:ribosomal protein S27AE